MVTYSHASMPLGQSERAYYLSYFIIYNIGYEENICNQPEPGDPLGDFLFEHSLEDCWKS